MDADADALGDVEPLGDPEPLGRGVTLPIGVEGAPLRGAAVGAALARDVGSPSVPDGAAESHATRTTAIARSAIRIARRTARRGRAFRPATAGSIRTRAPGGTGRSASAAHR